jgi:putative radical SAM enzyme (TIGR03279 family)
MSQTALRPALITGILPHSIAAEVGFEPGDRLVSINGEQPRDLIDYQFLCADEVLQLEVLDAQGQIHQLEIEKEYDQDLGLEFETALFDGLIQCNNRCPFCFIDQQPPGLRASLYFKDDDYRLSFLYGSYLTLTNLSQREWDRIARMRLSPLFVSVHATEPAVRIQLLKNPRAGQILEQLQWFQDHRLQIHAQVVVCPEINDGHHLETTLLDLARFHRGDLPAVASVAVVPLGLTRFRPGADQLLPVTSALAQQVIAQVQQLQGKFRDHLGSTFAWLADEWFLIADQPLPPESEYEDYPQLGNGVGSIQQFLRQFWQAASSLPAEITPARRLTWVVGNAVEQAFVPILERLNRVQGLKLELAALKSDYWGQTLTVTGLVTGQDILGSLAGKDLGDALLLPRLMLKQGEDSGSEIGDRRFLDDMTLEALHQGLGVTIIVVGGGAEDLIQHCLLPSLPASNTLFGNAS